MRDAPEQDDSDMRRIVGLQYRRGLPTLVFKANGEQAEEVLRQRQSAIGAPIVRDPRLARELYRLPVDAPIRRELFTAVAAVLVHVFSVEAAREASSHA